MVEIECQPLENWKLAFADRNISTCGELGKVGFYDSVSGEKTGDLKTSEFFGSAIALSPNNAYLAVGNNNGGLFVFNREKDNTMLKFQLHHKQIRSLAFTEDSSKLISGCDDQSIKVFDIESE